MAVNPEFYKFIERYSGSFGVYKPIGQFKIVPMEKLGDHFNCHRKQCDWQPNAQSDKTITIMDMQDAQPVPGALFDNPDFVDAVTMAMRAVLEAENEMWLKVAEQCLGALPVLADGERFTKITHEQSRNPINDYQYHIAFDDVVIGVVYFSQAYGWKFEPVKNLPNV